MKQKAPCSCEGKTLDRLLQPTVMALLAEGPLHGYALVEKLKDSPLMKGNAPDRMGVYRLLARLEEQEVVSHEWKESEEGPAKRLYELTNSGRNCLDRWGETLEQYREDLGQLVALMRTLAPHAAT